MTGSVTETWMGGHVSRRMKDYYQERLKRQFMKVALIKSTDTAQLKEDETEK